ncbi:PAS domain-containing protein, partial [Desulfocurvibacter africanus]|uniref:PAS domain-containing protein n=1 Tax=Desulfocurvibacter africanus TaxID=873 RepID=UPI002FD8B308
AIVRVIPVPQSESGNLLVVFEDKGQSDGDSVPAGSEADVRVSELLRELHAVRQDLQATIEKLETSNEELKSANEEQQANNEELQSANEELETSREELQSTNEELEGVNAQLQRKNEELGKANSDIRNLFAASDTGALFLDEELRIKRFTPSIRAVFNLREDRDIGRPITDIASRLAYDGLEQDASQVLDTLGIREVEVQTKDGRWFLMRVRPYRTMENVIEGVVMSFSDISSLKQASIAERLARILAEAVMETIREPLLVLDGELRVLSANAAFYKYFKTRHDETEGQLLYELGNNQLKLEPLRKLLEEIIPGNAQFQGFRVEADFSHIGRRAMLLNARRIDQEDGRPRMILLAFDDVTDKPTAPDMETRP